jgi:hypothetical protein
MNGDDRVRGDRRDWEALLRFDPEFVDVVARRIIELTHEASSARRHQEGDLLTVAEVAARLRVSPGWVYAHKHELGVIKLGDGPKARIRFDPAVVDEQLAAEPRHPDPILPVVAAPVKRRRRRLASRPLPTIDRAPGAA